MTEENKGNKTKLNECTLVQERNSRKKRNIDLIERMRGGESLTLFDSIASWFPPRPKIPKDPEALKKLYETKKGE